MTAWQFSSTTLATGAASLAKRGAALTVTLAYTATTLALTMPASTANAQEAGGATALFVPETPNVERLAMEVEVLGEDQLAKQPGVVLADVERRLGATVVQDIEAQLALARRRIDEGRAAFAAVDETTAQLRLSEAIQIYETYLAYVPRDGTYEEALLLLGGAAILAGDPETASLQFRKLLAFQPNYSVPPSKYPPMVTEAFDESRRDLLRVPLAEMKIDSQPANAHVYVDGTYQGMTPVVMPSVPAGEHFVTFEKKGYHRDTQRVMVLAQNRAVIAGNLPPTGNYATFTGLKGQATREMVARQVGTGSRELARWTGSQYLMLGSVGYTGSNVTLTAAYYDFFRPGQEMRAWEQRTFDGTSPNLRGEMEQFLRGLLEKARMADQTGVAMVGAPMAMPGAPVYANAPAGAGYVQQGVQPQQQEEGIEKKWWFWTIIGVVVVSGATVGTLFATGVIGGDGGGGGTDNPNGQLVLTF